MSNNLQQNFNTFSNIFFLFVLFFGGLVYADTNGVWQYASDTRGGTFGSDESGFNSAYTFMSPVLFGGSLKDLANPNTYFINLSGRTQLNDIAVQKLSITNTNGNAISLTSTSGDGISTTTSATGKSAIYGYTTNPNSYSGFFDGKFVVNSGNVGIGTTNPTKKLDVIGTVKGDNLILNSAALKNCAGKLVTDANGNVYCGVDQNSDTWITTQTCPAGQVLKSVGKNSKTCVVDQKGIITEIDPQVGTLINGKWCTSNGSSVNCNSAAPSGTPNFIITRHGGYHILDFTLDQINEVCSAGEIMLNLHGTCETWGGTTGYDGALGTFVVAATRYAGGWGGGSASLSCKHTYVDKLPQKQKNQVMWTGWDCLKFN